MKNTRAFDRITENANRALSTGEAPITGEITPQNPALAALIGKYDQGITVLASPPGVGKTMLLVSEAVLQARAGHSVLYVTVEQSEDEIAPLAVTAAANAGGLQAGRGLKISAVSESLLTPEEHEAMEAAKEELAALEIDFVDHVRTVHELAALLVKKGEPADLEVKYKPDIIFVDSFSAMRPDAFSADEVSNTRRLMEELTALRKWSGVPIVGISHMSQTGIRKTTKATDAGQSLTAIDADAMTGSLSTVYMAGTIVMASPSTPAEVDKAVKDLKGKYEAEHPDEPMLTLTKTPDYCQCVKLHLLKGRAAGLSYKESRSAFTVRVDETALVLSPKIYREITQREAEKKAAQYKENAARWKALQEENNNDSETED